MSRITANDLDNVNRWVYGIRAEMSEMVRKYGTSDMDETAFLTEECDSSGLFWLGELLNMVEETLSVYLSGMSSVPGMSDVSGLGDKTYMDLWSALYKKVVLGTVLGYLHRMRDLSGKPGSSGMALAYEMSVLDAFSRWSDLDHLGEMSEWSLSAYLYEMSPLY